LGLQSSSAQPLFRAKFNVVAISTNQNGKLVYHPTSSRQLIRECASHQGITNLAGLQLVFDLSSNALEVVSGTNQTVVCTPFTFQDSVSLASTNKKKVERQAWVFVETNTVATGTLTATEQFTYGSSNQLTGYRLNGHIQYTVAQSGSNSSKIYRGVILAGSRSDQGEDNDDQ